MIWAIRVAEIGELGSLYPDDHPVAQNAREHGGAWIVAAHPAGDGDEEAGRPTVDLTRELSEARRFETEQEALAFTRLPGCRALPLAVVGVSDDG